jgi:hypothetical protein
MVVCGKTMCGFFLKLRMVRQALTGDSLTTAEHVVDVVNVDVRLSGLIGQFSTLE